MSVQLPVLGPTYDQTQMRRLVQLLESVLNKRQGLVNSSLMAFIAAHG